MTTRDGILILDPENAVVVEANPFLTFLLGYRREELVGRPFAEIGLVADRLEGETLIDSVRREGYVRRDDQILKRRDGSLVVAEVVGNSYFVDDRTVIQLNIGDVTEHRAERQEPRPEEMPATSAPCGQLNCHARAEMRMLLRTITLQARALLKADAAELFLHRPEREALGRCVSVGVGGSRLGYEVRRGEALAGRVWETQKTVRLQNVPQVFRRPEVGKSLTWNRALGAPIRWHGEFLGALGVYSAQEKGFSESDTKHLDLLAGQAAMAVINARLASELEQLTVVDELTGVFNRRGLLTAGRREVERARRLGRPLAILFVDLDHFKALNDAYSHDVGDKALREVSRTIHGSMRKIDMVARYGGEEFVVLLVETELASAVHVAERVRQAVERWSLLTERGTARVTVSVGVSARGPETPDLDALIHRADEAMYAAKQAGRNRVVALAS
jgi:diguanylate cyclase (GGDEF)-like protein/PAS domain S-box-containing protein